MNVFISYARHDQAIALLIREYLSNLGISVWIDSEGIAGGENWVNAIEKAIQEADWILVLLSNASIASQWIRREIHLADSNQKRILPVVIEHIDISTVPIVLQPIQMLDISENIELGLIKLGEILQRYNEPEYVENPPSEEEIQEEKRSVLETPSPERIFIAYSRKQRPLAKELSELLYKHNKPNFYDAKLRAGAVWRQTIQKALDDATHVVVIWTTSAAQSNEVEREVSYALSEGKVIVPILGKEIPKLPYHLHGLHYIVLEEDLSKIEEPLMKAIAQFTDGEDIWK